MRNWVIATIVAASVGGGGAVYYVVAVPPAVVQPAPAASAPETTSTGGASKSESKKESAAAGPEQARPEAPAAESQVAVLPAAPAAVLRFKVEVTRTDKPGLGTAWTAACPRSAMGTLDGCRVDDRKGVVEGASGIAVFDDGNGRIGFVRDLSIGGTGLSRGTGVGLPPGIDYPMLGRGGPNSRWAIPINDFKRGVDFRLYISRMENVGMTIKRTSEEVGRAKVTLLD